MVDFITKLPLVVEKDAILVMCDRLSKIVYFVAIIEEISAERLVRLFRDNVWKLYGLSESVISDRKPQFVAELIKKLNRIFFRVEHGELYLFSIFFSFLSYFPFIFIFWKLRVGFNIMSSSLSQIVTLVWLCVTHQSHDHMLQ